MARRRLADLPGLGAPALARSGAPDAAAALAPGLGQAIDVGFAERAEGIKRRQRADLNKAESQITGALNVLAEEYSQRTDIENDFVGEHNARAEVAIENILAGIEDDDVRAASQDQGQRWLNQQSRGLQLKAAKIEADLQIQVLDEGLAQDAARFGLATTDEERQSALNAGNTRLITARDENDISQEVFIRKSRTLVEAAAGAYGRNLVNTDPARLLEELRDSEHGILKGIDGEDREILFASAQVQLRRRQSAGDTAQVAAQSAVYDEIVDRIYNPDNPLGPPTVSELRDMLRTFDPDDRSKAFEHFATIVARRANDPKSGNEQNHSLTNRLWADVQNGVITDSRDMLKQLGHGLSREDYDKLRQDIDDIAKDPNEAANRQALASFIKKAEPLITESIWGSKVDPRGDELAGLFRIRIEQLYRKGIEAGKDPLLDLLEPASKDFIGKILPQFIRSPDELQAQLEQRLAGGRRSVFQPVIVPNTQLPSFAQTPQQEPIVGLGTPFPELAPIEVELQPLAERTVTERREGESPTEFLKRTGR